MAGKIKASKKDEKTGAKKVVARVRAEGAEKVPHVLAWKSFEGADGSVHCRPVGDAPRHMRAVGKAWESDAAGVREMERRRRAQG